MDAIKIDNWSVVSKALHTFSSLSYEKFRLALRGDVVDHPKLGRASIITSQIVSVDDKYVKTESGSTYLLGEIDPKYESYLNKNFPDSEVGKFRKGYDSDEFEQFDKNDTMVRDHHGRRYDDF